MATAAAAPSHLPCVPVSTRSHVDRLLEMLDPPRNRIIVMVISVLVICLSLATLTVFLVVYYPRQGGAPIRGVHLPDKVQLPSKQSWISPGYAHPQVTTNCSRCNGETCVTYSLKKEYCLCEGTYGARCELSLNDLQNCTNFDDPKTCVCLPGYTGLWCTEEIDNCQSNPCGQSGACINQPGAFMCVCQADTFGDNCARSALTKYLTGGPTGTPASVGQWSFNEEGYYILYGSIQTIEIRYNRQLIGIRTRYGPNTRGETVDGPSIWGYPCGDFQAPVNMTIYLNPYEYITSVNVKEGNNMVCELSFTTSYGNHYETPGYAGYNVTVKTPDYDYFLSYFGGRCSGSYVHQLEFWSSSYQDYY